jgi:hypothetical protein
MTFPNHCLALSCHGSSCSDNTLCSSKSLHAVSSMSMTSLSDRSSSAIGLRHLCKCCSASGICRSDMLSSARRRFSRSCIYKQRIWDSRTNGSAHSLDSRKYPERRTMLCREMCKLSLAKWPVEHCLCSSLQNDQEMCLSFCGSSQYRPSQMDLMASISASCQLTMMRSTHQCKNEFTTHRVRRSQNIRLRQKNQVRPAVVECMY